MSKIVDERLRVSKIILGKLTKGSIRWRDLEKIVCAESPTYPKFSAALKWLLRGGYVERPARGVYRITEKGRRFLEAL